MPIVGAIPNTLTAGNLITATALQNNFQYIADQVNANAGTGSGGQMLGSAATKAIFFNSQTISEDLTIVAGTNGLSAGPITIASGNVVTIADGCSWSIV